MATAVLPVCLSPMINSLWPLPMGTKLSTALIPVCMGSLTDCLGMIPGAFRPTLYVSFHDQLVITKDDNTNVVRLQVESHALQSGAELHHLFGLDVLETIDTSNTVSNGQDTSSFLEIDGGGSSQNSLLEDGGDLSSSSLGNIN